MDTPVIVTLTGPSSSGKTVLSSLLAANGFHQIVSTTTRLPRAGERNGVNYHFMEEKDFLRDVAAGRFIENVVYDGNRYGVPAAEAEAAAAKGQPCVLVVDPRGVESVRAYCEGHGWKHLAVFVNNPVDLLLRRMLARTVADVEGLGASPAPEDVSARVDANAKRIERMLWDEQASWVSPALDGTARYDLIVDGFNEANTDEVLCQVRERLADTAPPTSRRPRRQP